ncbi:hypothetical protein BH11ACT4_BH11ACT4_23600 [soil metagenome]
MHEAVRRIIVRPLIQRWLRSSSASWRTLPTPAGRPMAKAVGPNADRLLLVGSGIAVGYGVKTHDLALAGQLATRISELTGRGAQVDVLVTEEMTVAEVREALTRKWLVSVDGIVATPGGFETLMLHSPGSWRRQIAALLDHVTAIAPASLRVFLVGLPQLPDIVRMPPLFGFLARRSARDINAELRLLCAARPNATFIDFAPTELAGRTGTGRTYRQWAELIAPLVAAELEGTPATRSNARPAD